MANDIKLQSEAGTHPLDENLRPLKIGNSTSPLELSNTDVKVNNLVVGGTTTGISASDDTKLPLAGGTMTGDITTDSNIVHTGSSLHIDASGDILISAAGDDISFSSDGIGERFITLSHATGSGNFIQTFAPDSVTSYSSYLVAANSATVISTSDADGSAGHFTLNIDGDIILDAVTGITKFYLAGDTDDLCTLTVAANGVTTIATADSDGAVGHLTLDVDGFLKLDAHAYAEGEGVQFLLAGTHVGNITGHHTATNFRLYENIGASTDDYFNIATGASGATIIKTEDAGGVVGHLTLDIDGHVQFDGCAVGFDLETPTYNASDTDVSFITGNKQFVTFGAGNITDLNLIFPETSGNFVLLLKQDGTGSRTVTNYKAWDLANDDAADGSATVKFAGGSNPTLTTDANHVDIISIFWDADNQIAYGVASLDFQF